MKLVSVRLLVNDFDACLRFYRDVLGFEAQWGKEGDGYAFFNPGSDVGLELFAQRDMAAAIGATATANDGNTQDQAVVSFSVENVDAAVQQLQGRGVQFTTLPTDRPMWGVRTAHFRDPDGNLIELYHSLAQAQ